ncbi:MAG: hypothetical protein FWH21_06185 [Kiritimatiellaeota bacterium]|nr:hypothetical protein [Kiritimatiellota bacterium]
MIEVLVASTIMIMIMMMLGMLFQQTSQAWRTGRQRAEALLKARALFGILQRDVSSAVDIYTLHPDLWPDSPNRPPALAGLDQSFNSGALRFFTLTGTGYNRDKSAFETDPPLRSLTHVTYQGGTREEIRLMVTDQGGVQRAYSAPAMQLLSQNLGGQALTLNGFDFHYLDTGVGGAGRFPSVIIVKARATASTDTVEIGAGSAGPNRKWGKEPGDPDGKDDIKTWTDNEK